MKKFKVFMVYVLVIALVLGLSACQKEKEIAQGENQTKPTDTETDVVSEFPSSKTEISSHDESSDLSSIASEIISSQESSIAESSKPASSKPASSKPAPPKPTTTTPTKPASSTPTPSKPASSKPVQNVSHDEMRAVWIAFLEFDSFKGSSESAFTARINQYFDTCLAKGLNTVIVQVRPHGDSMYPSQYYPWSKHASGVVNTALPYDPLAIMVSQAHSRNLEIHAWINPYRTMLDSEMALVSDNFPTKQWFNSADRDNYMVKCGDGRWWLKPGNKEVQKLIVDGAKEIVSNYNVDGVHIDDYFYGTTVSNYGDSVAQAKANTTAMVKGLYDGINSINTNVKFGVSPAGGFRMDSSLPASDLTYLSTDLNLWCKTPGYIDYVMPQIYWDYYHSIQPFSQTLAKWEQFVTADSVALYIGLAPYKYSDDIIHQMMTDSINNSGSNGYALFRYDHILGL